MNPMRTICITFFALVCAATAARAQQPVEARIAGLERNEEYMALLREEALLQQREDSIAAAVVRVRALLRDDPENGRQHAQQIMQSENRIFEVRTKKGRVLDRINTIEQEWVLANLDADAAHRSDTAPEPSRLPDSLKVRNLVKNRPFARHLPAADYAALQRAQRAEPRAEAAAARFAAGHAALAELERAFDSVRTEEEAFALKERFAELEARNRRTADTLSALWNDIFDNKSYAYDYLLEALRKEALLDRQSARLSETLREVSSLQGRTASDELVDYVLRKRMLVEYERSIAETFELDAACDSLQVVRERLARLDCRLPKVSVADRIFIPYDTLVFSPRPLYTAQNPIPPCKIYERGTIYRVLLGTFQSKRPVSTFRNTAPLCYLEEGGRWRYFAGGFATAAEAQEAQARLKKRGFLRPEVVVWIDGEYRNLSQEPLPTATVAGYRVEVVGSDALTDAMRRAVQALYPAAEVSRVGAALFVIGTFETREEAERAVEALRGAAEGASPEIKTVEIAE